MKLTLATYFDKIFYINRKEDVERNSNMLRQFEKWRITNFIRIEASEIEKLPPFDEYRNFIKSDIKYRLGSVSCRESHLNCIKQAQVNNWQKILIFEDDAEILSDPHELLRVNEALLNDWDMLYFGGMIETFFRNQIVCTHAYAVKSTLFLDILNMAVASGMEIDCFYARIIHHMSYGRNQSGKYNIRTIHPFNRIIQNQKFQSNIR